MKLSTQRTGELFTQEHISGFLKAVGIECAEPVKVKFYTLAGDANPILFLDHSPVNGEAISDTYSIYAPDPYKELAELFSLPKHGYIISLIFNWKVGSFGELEITQSLSVVESEVKSTNFKAIKQGQ